MFIYYITFADSKLKWPCNRQKLTIFGRFYAYAHASPIFFISIFELTTLKWGSRHHVNRQITTKNNQNYWILLLTMVIWKYNYNGITTHFILLMYSVQCIKINRKPTFNGQFHQLERKSLILCNSNRKQLDWPTIIKIYVSTPKRINRWSNLQHIICRSYCFAVLVG